MRILLLTQIIPYPPDAGPRVKTWHVLRYLIDRGHRVVLVSFLRPDEEPNVGALEEICEQVYTIPLQRSRIADAGYWLKSQLTRRPFLIERDDRREVRELVRHLIDSEVFDVIHADQLTMAQFALPFAGDKAGLMRPIVANSLPEPPDDTAQLTKRPILVYDAHNAVWMLLERMRQTASFPLKPVIGLEARRIKSYEGQVLQFFDQTLAVSETDRRALRHAMRFAIDSSRTHRSEARISVIPIAVDTTDLQPVDRDHGSSNILAVGTLHFPPNADGVRWFLRDVFPKVRRRVPEATLTIVGKGPPSDLIHLASRQPEAVTVTGYVPDLAPFLKKAALMVVPVRAGGGMRVRILESFARAMPIVTTTVGMEGIDAVPDEHLLVADTESGFADKVSRLLQDEALQQALAVNGRRLAETCYDWRSVLGQLDEVYAE